MFGKEMLSWYVCPRLRYMSAVPVLNVVLPGMFGWASFDWDPDGANCIPPEGELLCMVFNMYIVIFWLVIPMIIIHTVVNAYKDLIHMVLTATKRLLLLACHELHDLEEKEVAIFHNDQHRMGRKNA